METVHFSFDIPRENRLVIDVLNTISQEFDLKNEDRLKRFIKHSSGILSDKVLCNEDLKKARLQKYAK